MYDIAGLTKGASTGAGLGNAFLSHIRAIDAIFQVVRAFDDAEIVHVEGNTFLFIENVGTDYKVTLIHVAT